MKGFSTPYQYYLSYKNKEACQYCRFDTTDKVWHCCEGWGIQGDNHCRKTEEFLCPIAQDFKFCQTSDYIKRKGY